MKGMKPLMLVDGHFVLVDFATAKDGGVMVQGERVADRRAAEVILGPKVLEMVDLARNPEPPDIFADLKRATESPRR
jgi:hypothetical protein